MSANTTPTVKVMRRRQSATSFARNYADVKADLIATEGAKVAAFRRQRALARDPDLGPGKQERHRAAADDYRQCGAP